MIDLFKRYSCSLWKQEIYAGSDRKILLITLVCDGATLICNTYASHEDEIGLPLDIRDHGWGHHNYGKDLDIMSAKRLDIHDTRDVTYEYPVHHDC